MSGTVEGLAKEIVSLDVTTIPELRESDEENPERELEKALEYDSDDNEFEPEFYQEWDEFQNEWREYLEGGH